MDDRRRQPHRQGASEVGLRVLILGLSPTRSLAKWDGYEVWGLAWDPEAVRFDRVFEMHDGADRSRFDDFARVYTQENFPLDEVAKTTGGVWCSSVAYMLSLAIHEGAEEIAVYGVDLVGDERYEHQHPNINFLLGLAMGKGIKVTLPESCPLLKFQPTPGENYTERYGKL